MKVKVKVKVFCVFVRERRVQKFKEYTETVVERKTGFRGRHMSYVSGDKHAVCKVARGWTEVCKTLNTLIILKNIELNILRIAKVS